MSKSKIPLIQGTEINPAFLKANSALLNNFNVTSVDQLIELWKQEYRAELKLPDYLSFDNQLDLTSFLLKWS